MKVLLGFALFFVIISGVGFAHSQNDTIPEWIKGVVVFWADGDISNSEFIEALEFLIESNIIQVSDPRVQELENENRELRQKIELLESENTSQPETTDRIQPQEKDELAYITTDRHEYGLGNIITVNGKIVLEHNTYGLDGNVLVEKDIVLIELIPENSPFIVDRIECTKLLENDNYGFKAGDYTYALDGTYHKCDIDDNGRFSINFEVMNKYQAGIYHVSVAFIKLQPHYEMISNINSEPFIIK